MWFGTHVSMTQTDWHWLFETFLCIFVNLLVIFSLYLQYKEEENEKGLTVTRYINQEGLKGTYSIYLSIDGKIYNTEEYVNFSQE